MRNVRQRQRRPTLEALRRARVDAGLTISELAKRAGVSRDTISHAERGRHSLQGPTLSKIAHALGRAPSELLAEEERLAPKVDSRSSLEPSLNDVLEEERHTAWEAAVENARGLRESGQTRMTELLSLWRASRERQEDAGARLEYRLEMADLLTQAQKAETDLFRNLSWSSSPEARRAYKEAKKAGAREVPNADWEEFREAARFYYRLRGMVEGFELRVLTGDAAAAAEQAAADEAAAEHVQSETTPHRVEELDEAA